MLFPDQLHVELIRRRLWQPRQIGNASVFIGAGFSRNAEPLHERARAFSTWAELAAQLDEDLYPGTCDPLDSQVIARRSNAPRLAQLYATTFGEASLVAAVRQAVPDADHRPGHLHKLLLDLPWADVFTTNYDTLLERARLDASVRRTYQVVETETDIPGSRAPRIVKLHGSFPSLSPFILTEHHFRTYPVSHASFVNTVRQSLLENALVMIGFGGEDPNFLDWAGWLRDRLGDRAPSLYLCGVFDYTISERALLGHRGVTLVDLGPLVPADQFAPGERHRVATEWLLHSLRNGRPPYTLKWPELNSNGPFPGPPPPDDPAPLPAPSILTQDPPRHQPGPVTSLGGGQPDLLPLKTAWATKREQYPGWRVLPVSNREKLWHDTEQWIDAILEGAPQLDPFDCLGLLYELIWRLERAAASLWVPWVDKMEEILSVYTARRGGVTYGVDIALPAAAEAQYRTIGFALLQRAREDADDEAFDRWHTLLTPLAAGRPEDEARLCHERVLWHLGRLERDEALQVLRSWPRIDGASFWEIRRAGHLAELGELAEAEEVATTTLQNLRLATRAQQGDLRLVSDEAWAVLLIEWILQARRFETDKSRSTPPSPDLDPAYRDRLAAERCNPWTLTSQMLTAAAGDRRIFSKAKSQSVDPLTGYTSTSFSLMGSGLNAEALVEVFALARLVDDVIPVRVGTVSWDSKDIMRVARHLAGVSSPWGEAIALRLGSEEVLKAYFDAPRIAGLPQDRFDRLTSQAMTRFVLLSPRAGSAARNFGSAVWQEFEGLCQLLGLLSFRFDEARRSDVIQHVMSVLRSVREDDSWWFEDRLYKLLTQLVEHSSLSLLKTHILNMLSLRPFNRGPIEETQLLVAIVNIIEEECSWSTQDCHRAGRLADSLTDEAKGETESRSDALFKLWILNKAGLLGEDLRADFVAAAWSRLNASGLPADTNLLPAVWFDLPNPEGVNVRDRIYTWVESVIAAPEAFDGPANSFPSPQEAAIQALIYVLPSRASPVDRQALVTVSPALAAKIAGFAIRVWESGKTRIKELDDGFAQDLKRAPLRRLPQLVLRGALPYLVSREDASAVSKMLDEMAAAGFNTFEAEVEALRLLPELKDDLAHRMRRGLNAETERAANVAEAVAYWTRTGPASELPNCPEELVDDVVLRLVDRRRAGRAAVVRAVTQIVRFGTDSLSRRHFAEITSGLEAIFAETKLLGDQERAMRSETDEEIYAWRPLRQAAARLGTALSQELSRLEDEVEGSEIAERLAKLAAEVAEDPYPEVRRAWEQPVPESDDSAGVAEAPTDG